MALQGGELKGIIWHQGESDRNQVDGYEDALVELVDRFRTEFRQDSLLFVAAHLGGYYTETEENAHLINAAMDRLPGRLDHVFVIQTDDLQHNGDGVHLSSESSRELGRRYAEVVMTARE